MRDNSAKIKELKEDLIQIEKAYYHKDVTGEKPINRTLRHIELLEHGLRVKEKDDGFLVNGKFIVAAQKNRWRVKGEWTWYWFKSIPQFVEGYL